MATVEQGARAAANGAGGHTLPVENPATGEVVAHVPEMGPDQVAELTRRARAAQPAWEALGFAGRARVMRAMRSWLMTNRERVMRALMQETGKTHEDAYLGELGYTADSLGFWAKRAAGYLADERIRPHSPFLLGRKVVVRHRPHGVVGVIGPWNYPLNNNFADAIPALMAGNAVVLKPSELTPLTSMVMAEGFLESGGPDDVLLTATGRGDTGRALVDHVDAVHFTGSTATGRRVGARAAERLIPCTLELGGNDPMIVLEDADLERTANAAVFYSMQNGGQTCISVERVYVEEGIYEPFVEKVVEKTRALRQGAPHGPGSVEVGAVTAEPQAEIVHRHVQDAVSKGATVRVGGGRSDGPGRFFEPTVLTGVDHSMEIMTEETFGPTLPIMKVRDADEAVRLANDTRYGLDSSVWTTDLEKGERIARRIQAGAACVNDAIVNYLAVEAPFGGTGESGIGARHGARGIQKYCQTQTILVTRFAPKREAHFFPYSKRTTKLLERALVLLYGRRSKT